jgi:hypothetical protein
MKHRVHGTHHALLKAAVIRTAVTGVAMEQDTPTQRRRFDMPEAVEM